MVLQQRPTALKTGAAFAFPIGDGRFAVCRVVLGDGHHVSQFQSDTLVACSKWIGNEIPCADDPALRPILHLNHHSIKNSPCVGWIPYYCDLPEDFIYIGTIDPTVEERAIKCLSGWDRWSGLTHHPLTQWRWDHDRDALLAEERKREEDRQARHITRDSAVVVDDHGLTHKGVRLEWEQVREVGAEGLDFYFATVPMGTITSDCGEFYVDQDCAAFPAIVKGLDTLPGFPSLEFRQTLKRPMFGDRVTVWRRDVTEPVATADGGRDLGST